MTGAELRGEVARFAEANGILAGVCGANPMEYLLPALSVEVPFVSYTPAERINPASVLPGVRSVVVIGAAKGSDRTDYHITVKTILQSLAAQLSGFIAFDYAISADTGPLPERELARRAGLGFIGRNRMLISSKFGSYFNIGCLLTDIPVCEDHTGEPYAPGAPSDTARGCCGCEACIRACPGGALSGDAFDCTRCVSYLTQRKGLLTPEEMRSMGENLYGCTACQDACPYNKPPYSNLLHNGAAAFSDAELIGLLGMSGKQFAAAYGKTEFGWRGHRTLKRNALIALGNRYARKPCETTCFGAVARFLDCGDETLSQTAAWAFKTMEKRG